MRHCQLLVSSCIQNTFFFPSTCKLWHKSAPQVDGHTPSGSFLTNQTNPVVSLFLFFSQGCHTSTISKYLIVETRPQSLSHLDLPWGLDMMFHTQWGETIGAQAVAPLVCSRLRSNMVKCILRTQVVLQGSWYYLATVFATKWHNRPDRLKIEVINWNILIHLKGQHRLSTGRPSLDPIAETEQQGFAGMRPERLSPQGDTVCLKSL